MKSHKENILKVVKNASTELSLDDFFKLSKFNEQSYILSTIVRPNIYISQHISHVKSNMIDIILSITIPKSQNSDCSVPTKVKFYLKDESCTCGGTLFELDMIPGNEYILKDPIPLFVIPFTNIWFDGCSELEMKFIIIYDLELRKNISLSQTIGSIEEIWSFMSDSPKYFIQHGGLQPWENKQIYYDTFIKPYIHIHLD